MEAIFSVHQSYRFGHSWHRCSPSAGLFGLVSGGRVLFVQKVAVSLLHCASDRPKLLIRRAAQHSDSIGNRYVPRKLICPVADRSNTAQGIDGIAGRGTLTFTLNGALQALRIPSHDAVGEQGQCS